MRGQQAISSPQGFVNTDDKSLIGPACCIIRGGVKADERIVGSFIGSLVSSSPLAYLGKRRRCPRKGGFTINFYDSAHLHVMKTKSKEGVLPFDKACPQRGYHTFFHSKQTLLYTLWVIVIITIIASNL